MAELSVYDNDPTLYLFTSLTAGSSHIVTATSRIETILKANKIPFKGVDTATDDLARKLYGRRGGGKKLPLLVKEGYVLGGIEEIEEWNEYDELEEALGVTPVAAPIPAKPAPAQSGTASTSTDKQKENTPATSSEQNLAIRQLGAEAAKVAASKKPAPSSISTTNPLLAEKAQSPAASAPNSASVLSPRSIPLPFSPNPAKSTGIDKTAERTAAKEHNIPKLSSKPVHSPPSMHADAANPKLAVAPLSATRRPPPSPLTSPLSPSSGSDGSSVKEFHGSRVGTASEEEIKQIEKEQAIAEVSSEEEEDSEEEIKQIEKKQAIAEVSSDDDDDEEEEEEEDSDEENEVSKNEVKSKDGKVLEQSEKPKDKANEGKEK